MTKQDRETIYITGFGDTEAEARDDVLRRGREFYGTSHVEVTSYDGGPPHWYPNPVRKTIYADQTDKKLYLTAYVRRADTPTEAANLVFVLEPDTTRAHPYDVRDSIIADLEARHGMRLVQDTETGVVHMRHDGPHGVDACTEGCPGYAGPAWEKMPAYPNPGWSKGHLTLKQLRDKLTELGCHDWDLSTSREGLEEELVKARRARQDREARQGR